MADYGAIAARNGGKPSYADLAKKHGGRAAAAPAAAAADNSGDFMSQVGDAVSSFGRTVNPVTMLQGMGQATSRPVETAEGMLSAQGALVGKAQEAFSRGDWGGGTRHLIEYLIPILGPGISQMGDKAQQGKVGEAVGEAAATGLLLGAPGVGGTSVTPRWPGLQFGGPGARVTPKWVNPNPAVAAAIETVEAAGVPVSAALKTGNTFIKIGQKLADSTFGGSRIAGRADARTAAAMSRVADDLSTQTHPTAVNPETAGIDIERQLAANESAAQSRIMTDMTAAADRTHPHPMTPEQSGTGTRNALEGKTAQLGGDADKAYEPFHRAAASPQYRETVSWEDATAQTPDGMVTETMNMPVDISELVQVLEPLVQEWQMLVEPARRNASRGFTAAKSILEWNKPYMPAELAEKALGGLKDLTRQGKYQGKGGDAFERVMRDENQGVAGLAVQRLQEAIDSKVASVDPVAMQGLQDGRQATARKYEVADLVAELRDEPVLAFQQATYAQDAGINFLRELETHAPGQMSGIARAFLAKVIEKGQQGDWKGAQSEWAKLGPSSRQSLFPQTAPDIERVIADGLDAQKNRLSTRVPNQSVKIYNLLTASSDANIDLLRKVQAEAPGEMPKLARAYLEGLWDTARQEGGFMVSKSLFNKWQALGDGSQKILFPNPLHRRKLEDFFLAGKAMAENPNPSGTALNAAVGLEASGWWDSARYGHLWGPLASLSATGVSALLHSPRGVDLLTKGLKMPTGSKAQAAYWTATTAELMKLAGEKDDTKKNAR